MLLQQEGYPVTVSCSVINLARSSYYYRPEEKNQEVLKAKLLELAGDWPTYGYRRLTHQSHREGTHMNHKVVLRLMRELGLLQPRKRSKKKTTDSKHQYQRFPNLVEEIVVDHPDQVWVGDITYVRLRFKFVYLAILMDVFTRAIRGWHLGQDLTQSLTRIALERGLSRAVPTIHHSDQGWQYAAVEYVERLQSLDVAISMAEVGQAWQNGFAERLIRTIREEAIDLTEYYDYHDAYRRIGHFIEDVYMKKRIHSSLGYLTPAEFEQQWFNRQLEHSEQIKNTNNLILGVQK